MNVLVEKNTCKSKLAGKSLAKKRVTILIPTNYAGQLDGMGSLVFENLPLVTLLILNISGAWMHIGP